MINTEKKIGAVSIAIHIREGGGFDTDHTRLDDPLKLPPLPYYIEALSRAIALFPEQKIYCHLFTDAGDAEAMTQLALLTDFKDARALLERAAETGHVSAIRHLSDLIIAAEPVEALAWLEAGAALGAAPALAKRAQQLAREMSADEIAAAQKKGRALLREIKQANRL